MKQNKLKFELNLVKLIAWNILFVTGMCIIVWYSIQKINLTYEYILTEEMVKQTKEAYELSITAIAVIAVILNGLWLYAVCGRSEIRRICEENTLCCSIGLSIALFIMIIAAGLRCPGITDDLDKPYPLYYSYSIGFWFLVNLFGFPPENVEKVLFFGGRTGRWIVAAAALILAGIVLSL